MELNYGVNYSNSLKKYSEEIIFGFCEHKKVGEISKDLERDYGVIIPFQAINWFYYNNKEYFDECIKNYDNDKKNKLKEAIGLDYVKEKLYSLFVSFDISPSELKKLPLEKKMKYLIPLVNAIAKCEGLDKSEININNHSVDELLTIFSDDLNWE